MPTHPRETTWPRPHRIFNSGGSTWRSLIFHSTVETIYRRGRVPGKCFFSKQEFPRAIAPHSLRGARERRVRFDRGFARIIRESMCRSTYSPPLACATISGSDGRTRIDRAIRACRSCSCRAQLRTILKTRTQQLQSTNLWRTIGTKECTAPPMEQMLLGGLEQLWA